MFVSQILDEACEILGTTDQTRVFRKLTQAVQALMESGHWFHTQAEVDICTGWDGCTVTLPRGIEVPLAVNVDGSPTYFRGRLFQYHVNKGGMFSGVSWCWDDRGFVSTQMDIRQPAQLVAVAESDADVGQTLRVVGTDGNGRELRTQLPDGTNVDGLLVQVHSPSDFARGSIIPDGDSVIPRVAAISPIDEFSSSSAHQLSTGEPVTLTSVSGTAPTGLTVSDPYYVGVVNPTTIQLYTDPLYAQQGLYPIELTSILGNTGITLTDARSAQLVTQVTLASAPVVTLSTANEVVFSGTVLPAPLVAGVTYFANQLSGTTLQIFASLADATAGTNPVYLTGSSASFNIQLRKVIAPVTSLVFNLPHLFATGDVVQAFTNGGTLPLPLVEAVNYYVQVVDSLTVLLHTSYADAVSGNNPIILTTSGSGQVTLNKLIPATATVGATSQITAPGFTLPTATGSGASVTAQVSGPVTALTITNAGSGYTSAPTVTISGGGGSGATAHAIVGTIPETSQYQTIIALVLDTPGQGYTSTPTVVITGGGGTGGAGSATVTYSFVTAYTVVSGGSGYTVPPSITFPTPLAGQTAPVAQAVISGGAVTAVNVISEGTGYTTAPPVTVTPSTGVLVSFSTVGTLPDPLQQGVTYRAEAPSSSTTFTLLNDDYSQLTLNSVGSGQMYLTISRAFSVGFTNQWAGDFSTVSTGQGIYFGTDYLLPVTSPPIDNGATEFYLRVLTSTSASVYATSAEASAGGSTGLVTISQLGSGQGYWAVQLSATGTPLNNDILLNSQQYLTEGMTVQVSSTGTLPSPLTAGTNYTLHLDGSFVQLESGGSVVAITSLGSSAFSVNAVRSFTSVAPTTVALESAVFQTGTPVVPRPAPGDILDPSLTAGTTYYTRFNDAGTVQLYPTLQEAQNLGSNTGQLTFTTIGNTDTSTFFLDVVLPPVLVKSVAHVEKPLTQGYVSLYALDFGRSNDTTLIGQYHPTECNPKYRRIRIGKPAAWVRMIYRVTAPKITSQYDYIPVEQERAILTALHAIDLEDKDFAEQAQKYWQTAYSYLRQQQSSMDGHAMEPIAVNGLTYGDRSDPVIEGNWGVY